MTSRTRKLIGTVLILLLITVYSLLLAALAPAILRPGSAWWVQLAFYSIGGLAWVFPAGMLISWMARPDAK